ncbi:MAG: hypothetical protein COY42_15745 [Armatimonadetes bacterium CG_4_10_14_0_8_um_filter_66_14]|nr:MAG: hypothetical protein COY42_15745 [Armatimonadetes bacterium CG_4_10_14_0_8_um_filter_66_14]
MNRHARTTVHTGVTVLVACTLAHSQPPPTPPTWKQAEDVAYSGQFATAVELLAGRLAEVPGDLKAWADLFLAIRGAAASAQRDQMLTFLARWAEEPHGSMGYAVLGYAQLMAGSEAAARAALKTALDAEVRTSGPALYLKAILHERAGEADAARDTWRAFLALSDEGPLADAVRQGWVVVNDWKAIGPGFGFTYPTLSPDGRLFLCSAWKKDGVHLVLFDPATGKERILVRAEEGQQLHRPIWSADGRELFYERVIPQKGEWPLRTIMRAPLRDNA